MATFKATKIACGRGGRGGRGRGVRGMACGKEHEPNKQKMTAV